MLSTVFFSLVLGASRFQDVPPWTPPKTTIPKEFIDAVDFVLHHGFADPRGGKFSTAKIKISATWSGGTSEVNVKGWVMPAKNGQPQVIVLPNGLSYPVLSVVGPADVNQGFEVTTGQTIYRDTLTYQEGYTDVACLLLTGNPKLAAQKYPKNNINPVPHIFVGIATPYLVDRFHRAVEAHMRGDDRQALVDSLALQKDRDDYEKEATRVLGEKYVANQARPDLGGDGKLTVFKYLDQIDDLVTDSQRRLSETKILLAMDEIKREPLESRLKLLVDRLDQVSARQMSQPGGVNLASDSIVQAFIDEGDAAVPILLDTIEKDKRLTRSVSFGRDFFPPRNLLSVRSAAYSAVREITQFNEISDYGQPIDVAKIRAYWAEYGSLKPADRWYKTLADDQAGWRKWTEAANRIISQSEVVTTGGFRGYRQDPTKPMHGESLRAKANPSISDLLRKRAVSLIEPESAGTFDLFYSLELAKVQDRWDTKVSLPLLQDISRKVMKLLSGRNGDSKVGINQVLLMDVLKLRIAKGDNQVLPEYVAWLGDMAKAEDNNSDGTRIFMLLVDNPNHPLFNGLAEKLFLSEDSNWNFEKMAVKRPGWNHVENAVMSPLLTLPAVQQSVKAILHNHTSLGTSWAEGGNERYKTASSGSGEQIDPKELPDPLAPKPGEIRSFRICDNLAASMTRLKGAPKFHRYWPDEAKDKAIEQLIALIDQHSKDMADLIIWPYDWQRFPPGFPKG